MKKLILTAFVLSMALGAEAQAPHAYPITAAAPYTTAKVYLTVDTRTVSTGPYARYAQKYLGVIAPLSDRTTAAITAARLDYADPDRQPQSAPIQACKGGDGEFARVQIDRMSDVSRSTEEMAREAANTIFRLRRQRLDILTGDTGELYPGGAGPVLDEITRIEGEYLALFMGKEARTVEVVELDVVPREGKNDYVVCRFSETAGVGADGEAVTLTFTPDGGVAAVAPVKGDRRQMVQYRMADFADCRLTYNGRELAARRMPVYQFGATVTAPAK